ncbi:fatty acid desaturase [Hyalangium versicolor]|uniref:fatty acid desaturase n=1 Tax=Hyalangium versicolor TaxID=2861190 RepID=UPI001CD02CFE|nr:fatty acid desaturase [Hyalangium versicolor]
MRDTDVRQDLQRFPGFTQPFWTWLTGKALPGQRPLMASGPWSYLASTLLTFAAGFALSAWSVLRSPPWQVLGVVLGWALTLNGARNMALVLVHQCGHFRFTKNPKVDRFVGECLSTLLFSQDLESYRWDHAHLHHGAKTFTTEQDPVLTFIRRFGFREGMTRRQLWLHTFKTLFSPYFHGSYLLSRFRYNLFKTRGWRRLGAWTHVALWVALMLLVQGMWKAWLLGFAVPVFFFYHQSAFLELLTEHAWFIPKASSESVRDHLATRCWGRFCASPLPPRGLPIHRWLYQWSQWWLAMAVYHLPMRFLVLVGDAPHHDFHHRHPGTLDWPDSAYARQSDIDSGHRGWPAYWDIWGFHVAVNYVFDALSGMPMLPGGQPVTPHAPVPVTEGSSS